MTFSVREVSLGEVCEIKQGRYLAPNQMEPIPTNECIVPVIGGNGVLGYTDQSTFPFPVPLVTCRGSKCGLMQWAEPPTWISNNAMAVYFKENQGDNFFLHQYLLNSSFDDVTTGSAQPQITVTNLSLKQILLPDLQTQKKISLTMKNIEAKIATNNALSKTLEDIAQTIFKSWFIDFDPAKAKMAGAKPAGMDSATAALFPDSMEQSELGIKPKEWKILEITELGKVVTGKTPSTTVAEYWGEDIPFVTIPDMHGTIVNTVTKRRLTVAGAESQKNQMLSRGSTMVSCIATPGLVVYATGSCQTNQQINSVIPKNLEISSWLYWHIRSLTSSVLLHSGVGTIFANLNKGDFGRIKSVVPPETLQLSSSQIFEPLLSQIESLSRENLILADIRDNLLPRLISGELQIPEEILAS